MTNVSATALEQTSALQTGGKLRFWRQVLTRHLKLRFISLRCADWVPVAFFFVSLCNQVVSAPNQTEQSLPKGTARPGIPIEIQA